MEAQRDGYELVHWMGDNGSSSGWQVSGLREGDMRVETADLYTRRDTIGQWKKMLQKEPPKKKACKYSKAEAQSLLVGFQKGSSQRQGFVLTCYITGQSFAFNEITRAAALRRQLVTDCLTTGGIPKKIVKFKAPTAPVPCFTSTGELLGGTGEEYRKEAAEYNKEALANYKTSMQAVLTWAAANLNEGTGKINNLLMSALPGIHQKSAKRAREVTPVKIEFLEELERENLFNTADQNKRKTLTVGECWKAVASKWPEFDHREAVMQAFTLADADGSKSLTQKGFTRFLKYLSLLSDYWHVFSRHSVKDDVKKAEWLDLCPKMLGVDLTASEKDSMYEDMNSTKEPAVSKDVVCAYLARIQGDADLEHLAKETTSPPRRGSSVWADISKAKSWKRNSSATGAPRGRRASKAHK
eukprot:TRINITY_DN2201_c5_g1_i1.p1 TRINITY_DN2201_c5_g1~~TRINITY_DN2201_c5_g1_i1.p1  ORF type:complete len:428 (+),score=90.33 TRINITY_DN2201_c5_g1_i1:46-1284(+)